MLADVDQNCVGYRDVSVVNAQPLLGSPRPLFGELAVSAGVYEMMGETPSIRKVVIVESSWRQTRTSAESWWEGREEGEGRREKEGSARRRGREIHVLSKAPIPK